MNLKDAYTFGDSNPSVRIILNNTLVLEDESHFDIKKVDISSGVGNEASICVLVLNSSKDIFKYGVFSSNNELKLVKQGSSIKVQLGYGELIYDAFYGFISSVKLDYEISSGVNIVVEALDAKMWMMPGVQTEKYPSTTYTRYSTIVRKILQGYQSYCQLININIFGEPQDLNKTIYQTNQSDYDFLCNLAEMTGCFFFAFINDVYFVSPNILRDTAPLIISNCEFLRSIFWESDVLGMPQMVNFEGLDMTKPSAPVMSTPIVKNNINVGTGLPAPIQVTNIGAQTKVNITDNTIMSSDEANFRAQAYYSKRSLNFIQCNVTVSGLTAITSKMFMPGMPVQLIGWDGLISNNYILMEIKHKYIKNSKEHSFKTELSLSTDCCQDADILDQQKSAQAAAEQAARLGI